MAEIKIDLGNVEFVEGGEKHDIPVYVAKDENLFVEQAKANGIDKKTLKNVADFANEYLREAIAKAKDVAAEKFKSDNLDKVLVDLPFGVNKSDKVEVMVEKEATYRNPTTGEEFTKPKIKVAVETKYSKVSKAYVKSLVDELAEQLANG